MATDKPPHQIGKAACKDGYRACKNVNGMWENTPHERIPLRAVTVRTTGPVRCHRPVATLLWARGNVDMGPWQRTVCLTGMEIKGIRLLVCRTETEDDA